MRMILPGVLAALLLACPAQASDVRSCSLDGVVQGATHAPGQRPRNFDLSVRVFSARPREGGTGYSDCSEFVGEHVDIRLHIPRRFGQPRLGDRVAFQYSAVDGVDTNGGYAGTSVSASLVDYEHGAPPQPR